jgi:NADPH:quinone reductase-like Zn-dependent oxidoreductase
MAPQNRAAYLDAVGTPLVVRDAPYTAPAKDQVTILNHALAINPVDVGMQMLGILITEWPYILGCDIAGVVHEIGSEVTQFKPGDRVFAFVTGMEHQHPTSAFQLYTNAFQDRVTKIPDSLSFEAASVLPLAVATAASALFQTKYLGLEAPTLEAQQKEEYVLIWSGSSSVGATAIQFARNAGYRVITTASPHNEKFCQDLGAEKVFDYHTESIVEDVAAYLEGKQVAGIMDGTIHDWVLEKNIQIARKVKGKKRIASVNPPASGEHDGGVTVVGVADHFQGEIELCKKVFGDFLPQALANGSFRAKPDPQVVGKGLENLQAACDKLKAGVSATKIVVSL